MERQLRLGDILDDYCPRERRVTNHAVVAMIGAQVKQTRCATCEAEHEYKHAKVPRQRRKDSPSAFQAPVVAAGPKRVPPAEAESPSGENDAPEPSEAAVPTEADAAAVAGLAAQAAEPDFEEDEDAVTGNVEGPAHRRLIRATLPRLEGQPPASRPAPDFTIRTPAGGRANRFRPRNQRGGGQPPFTGNQSGNTARGGGQRNGNTRSPLASHQPRRFDGRKRSK